MRDFGCLLVAAFGWLPSGAAFWGCLSRVAKLILLFATRAFVDKWLPYGGCLMVAALWWLPYGGCLRGLPSAAAFGGCLRRLPSGGCLRRLPLGGCLLGLPSGGCLRASQLVPKTAIIIFEKNNYI